MPDLNSIRFRFVALIVLVISLGLGGFSAWNDATHRDERIADLQRQLDAIGNRLTTSLAVAVWEYNRKQITQIVDSEMSAPYLLGVLVTYGKDKAYGVQNQAGRREALSAPLAGDATRRFDITFHDGSATQTIGEVSIYATHRLIDEALRRDLRRTILQIVALTWSRSRCCTWR